MKPRCAAMAVVLGAAMAARAQMPHPPPSKRIEPGFGDVGPSVIGLRGLNTDLRAPSEFDSVFRIERADPFAPFGQRTSVYYMRAEGGLTAVFPRSVYTSASDGSLLPQIPPDTVFYMGALPREFTTGTSRPTRHAANWVNLSYQAAQTERDLHPFPERREPVPRVPAVSIFEDDAYRQRVVARLLHEALDASSH